MSGADTTVILGEDGEFQISIRRTPDGVRLLVTERGYAKVDVPARSDDFQSLVETLSDEYDKYLARRGER